MKPTVPLFLILVPCFLHSLFSQEAPVVNDPVPAGTEIASDRLELVSKEDGNYFVFEGNVQIRGTNLFASCDRMEVLSATGKRDAEGFGEFGRIQRIEATGNVFIQQAGREARAGRAIILPNEGKVILEENPVVQDANGMVTGYRMLLYQAEKRVVVEPGPEGQQPRVILPKLEDLGYTEDSGEEP